MSTVLKRKQTAFYITTVAQWLIPSKINIAKAAIQLMITIFLSITTIWQESFPYPSTEIAMAKEIFIFAFFKKEAKM